MERIPRFQARTLPPRIREDGKHEVVWNGPNTDPIRPPGAVEFLAGSTPRPSAILRQNSIPRPVGAEYSCISRIALSSRGNGHIAGAPGTTKEHRRERHRRDHLDFPYVSWFRPRPSNHQQFPRRASKIKCPMSPGNVMDVTSLRNGSAYV